MKQTLNVRSCAVGLIIAISIIVVAAIYWERSLNSNAHRFVHATIWRQYGLKSSESLERIEPVEVQVTRQEDVDRLASFFSEAELRGETPVANIMSLANIKLVRPSGQVVNIRIYPEFGGWSSQHGSWSLSPEFAPYFIELCQRLQQEQHPPSSSPGKP